MTTPRPAGARASWFRSAWGPAVVWAAVIFLASTEAMSAAATESVLARVLRWLHPGIPGDVLATIHFGVRKLAHFTEFLVFALLLGRGFERGSRVPALHVPGAALGVAVLYAVLDELHQAFVPGRTAAVGDVGFDVLGALAGATILRRRLTRTTGRATPAADVSRSAPSRAS